MLNDLPGRHMMQSAPVYIGRTPADSLALASTPVALFSHPFANEMAGNLGADRSQASGFHKVAF